MSDIAQFIFQDPELRDAGARALYAHHYFTTLPNIRTAHKEWDEQLADAGKRVWYQRWDAMAAELQAWAAEVAG